MKRIRKQQEPPQLTQFRIAAPQSTWDQMKNDPHFGGPAAYSACRTQLIANQGDICAYCEISIREEDPLNCRIEHFHPKSDITNAHNWALDWNNFLCVCSGGSNKFGSMPHSMEPLAHNLSCDAHKDQMIQKKKLPTLCDGWILNPNHLMASPSLLDIEKSTGKLVPDEENCANAPAWPGNQHPDFQSLVQHTIDMLNLNCDRLCRARRVMIFDIERNKKKQRDKGLSAQQGLDNLAAFYLRKSWPQFFTTIRICLAASAEKHLVSIAYQG